MAQYFWDFSSYATGAQPSDWTQVLQTGNTWTVDTDAGSPGGQRLTESGASDESALSPNDVGAISGDVQVRALIRVQDVSTIASAIVYVRASATLSPENLYGVMNIGTGFQLYKKVAGAFTSLGSRNETVVTGDLWWVVIDVTGTTLSAKVWKNGTTEPGFYQLSTSITDVTSGHVGPGAKNLSGSNFYCHQFSVGTAGDTAPTEAGVSQLATPTGFTFDVDGTSLSGSWNSVAGADTYGWEIQEDVAGVWTTFDSGSGAATTFQVTSGVTLATSYRARVRAESASLTDSPWSPYLFAATADELIPRRVRWSGAWTTSDGLRRIRYGGAWQQPV